MHELRALESWNLLTPPLPGRSRLYAMAPMGVGTPFVESLTGYVTRLAAAHAVSVGDLVGRVIAGFAPAHSPIISEPTRRARAASSGFKPGSHTINGVGENSTRWLHALETATSCGNLRFLTLLPLKDILPCRRPVFREVQAWCPQCLHDRERKDGVNYLPLVWNLRLVTVCAIHGQPLTKICPYCSQSFGTLLANSRPGYCGRCHHWLGTNADAVAPPADSSQADLNFPYWSARALGELVAGAPELRSASLRSALKENLIRCVDRFTGGNRAAFSEAIQCSNSTVSAWLTGRNVPRVDSLLRTCYHLNISVLRLLRDPPADWSSDSPVAKSLARRRNATSSQKHTDKIRHALVAALCEKPAPSVAQIARRLGLANVDRLRRTDSECCKQISANYRKAGWPNCWQLGSRRTICSSQEIQNALEASLAQDHPTSIPKIASTLGYSNDSSIRKRFPELCRANILKRAESERRREDAIAAILKKTLREDPAPMLIEVTRRLGLRRSNSLREMFPKLCDALLARRRDWEAKNRDRIGVEVKKFLDETEAATVDTVCRRFGFSKSYLRMGFPDLHGDITAGYWRRVHVRRAKRRQILSQETLHIVAQLSSQRMCATLERVLPLLSDDSAKDWKLMRAAVNEARRKLDVQV